MKHLYYLLVICILLSPYKGWAQSKLYLDLKVGASHNAAEGVYFDKSRLPFKPYSTLKDMSFDEQGVLMLRLQLREKWGISTGYSGSALAWAYSLQMPQQYTVNPYHGEWKGQGASLYMHQLPLLVSRTFREYNIRQIDTIRHTYLASFRLEAVLGGGLNRIGNNCLDCGQLGTGGLFYDTIEFKETPIVKRKWGGFLIGGVTARFYRLGKERLNLSVYYTQGLTDMVLVPVAYQYNAQRGATTLRVRGSGFSATLGIPIRLKTFSKAPPS
ncbi:hypothetical protein HNQ93_000478 [Hymenobacter luteus]|uniref:Outer membrane protein beta-barrel domain-containing protein n=2 Tax=Hymenobacter TaxID=89966 RepID=A0A7W9SZ49_9BACT|nr:MULTISPECIES: hypothetical protein [Hymenobacter]MBB4600042.1 hypothetical protein [Hymenobacter latericoloratus]MBB6057648.1 hypothetical protein [Hymenobacter luteus]